MPKSPKKPELKQHRHTGQFYVRERGKFIYFGTDPAVAQDRYDEWIRDWIKRNGPSNSFTLTCDELVLRYLGHCDAYYRDRHGRQTSEVYAIK